MEAQIDMTSMLNIWQIYQNYNYTKPLTEFSLLEMCAKVEPHLCEMTYTQGHPWRSPALQQNIEHDLNINQ